MTLGANNRIYFSTSEGWSIGESDDTGNKS